MRATNPSIPDYFPGGGELAPVSKEKVLRKLIQRVAVYLVALIFCILAVKKFLIN